MEQSVFGLQAKIMREYYKDFSKYAKGGILSAEEFDKMMQEMIDFE